MRALAWGAECDCRPRGVLSLALRRRSRVAGDGRALVGCRSTQDKKGSASFLSNTNRFMLRILSNPASTYSFEQEKRVRPSSCGPCDRACALHVVASLFVVAFPSTAHRALDPNPNPSRRRPDGVGWVRDQEVCCCGCRRNGRSGGLHGRRKIGLRPSTTSEKAPALAQVRRFIIVVLDQGGCTVTVRLHLVPLPKLWPSNVERHATCGWSGAVLPPANMPACKISSADPLSFRRQSRLDANPRQREVTRGRA